MPINKAKEEILKEISKRLLKYDPNIVEIVQFGSSVYAPEHARDVDILVITKKRKEYEGYLDAANPEDTPFNVDTIVVEVGRELREELLRGVLGSFKILYGDGRYILEYAKTLRDPSFEEARTALKAARDYMELAKRATEPLLKDRHVREAFNTLFHAARIAAMTYLSTEVSRWGLIRRMLPEPYKSEFKEIIDTLHIEYFYNGNYPKNRLREEFSKWYKKVEKFINKLERELKASESATKPREDDPRRCPKNLKS